MKDLQIGDTVKAKFACMNKNNTLQEYRDECSKPEFEDCTVQEGYENYPVISGKVRNWTLEDCIIKKVVKLNGKQYVELAKSLLENRKELFENIGGFEYTGDNKEIIETEDDMLLYKRPDLMKEFKTNNIRECVLVVSGKSLFLVDTQGYDYARYVGLVINS